MGSLNCKLYIYIYITIFHKSSDTSFKMTVIEQVRNCLVAEKKRRTYPVLPLFENAVRLMPSGWRICYQKIIIDIESVKFEGPLEQDSLFYW